MKKLFVAFMVILTAASAVGAQALDWQGVGTTAATSANDTNFDNPDMYLVPGSDPAEYRLPTAADTVTFFWNSSPNARNDLAIPVGSGFEAFAIRITNIGYQNQIAMPLYLQKSLTLDNIYLRVGYTGQGTNILRVGSSATKAELLLTQVSQDAITGGDVTIQGITGSAVLDFSGLTALDPLDLTTTRNARRTQIIGLITAQTANTGLTASGATNIIISSVGLGSSEFVKIIPGTATFSTIAVVGNVHVDTTSGEVTNLPLSEIYGLDFVESTLELSGSRPVDLASDSLGTIATKWGSIQIFPGSKLLFTNQNVDLIQQTQRTNTVCSGAIGGLGGTVEFTAAPVPDSEDPEVIVPATITLQNPGIRSDGAINVGSQLLRVRSDQQWLNPSGVSFVRMLSVVNQPLMQAIDGQRLDNFGQVALIIATDGGTNPAIPVPGGTYQSWHIVGSQTSGRTCFFDLTGDVNLVGQVALPGNNTTVVSSLDTANSLFLNTGQRQRAEIRLMGNNLNVALGAYLYNSNYGTGEVANGVWINASATLANLKTTTVNIGGDLTHNTGVAGGLPGGGAGEARSTGIRGDGLSVINLGGSYFNPLRSMTNENMSRATLRMLSGTDVAPKTLEVMGHAADLFGNNTSAIGELVIGNGVAPAFVKLVNENRNDGGETWADEVLLVRNLTVAAGSTLDCNTQVIGGVKMAAPAPASIYVGNYTIGIATGVCTLVGKKGTHSFDMAEMGGRTMQHFADAVNAGTEQTGLVAVIRGWNVYVESEGTAADEFVLAFGTNLTWDTRSGRASGNLAIAPTGKLDLNTGLPLSSGLVINKFVGLGDQTVAWNAVKDQVFDSGNPEVLFEAVAIDIAEYPADPEEPQPAPIWITKWQVAGGAVDPDPLDVTVSIEPDFVYMNNNATQYRNHAVLSVVVNNAAVDETFTVEINDISNASMLTVEAGATSLQKRLVGGTRNIAPKGECTFTVTVTSNLNRSTLVPVAKSIMVRLLGDVNGNGFVTVDDLGSLNNKLNGVQIQGVVNQAFDIDGSGFITVDDLGMLNNILNGVTIN